MITTLVLSQQYLLLFYAWNIKFFISYSPCREISFSKLAWVWWSSCSRLSATENVCFRVGTRFRACRVMWSCKWATYWLKSSFVMAAPVEIFDSIATGFSFLSSRLCLHIIRSYHMVWLGLVDSQWSLMFCCICDVVFSKGAFFERTL